jgi:WD40 repeat protein
MGVVYKARQVRADRLVALKMILSGAHASDQDLNRFRIEAQAVARLQHANIVQVYEVGDDQGLPFFSLEFCSGGSLEKKLAGTPLPTRDAARVVEILAHAVQAAHHEGIIHRDLKPANVLLAADGAPKIADFGLAKKLDAAGPTASNAIMGTPSYMAPEQAGGKGTEVGPAADVYALGAILYECLTGRPPFRAATPLDTLLQVATEDAVSPRRLQPQVPRDLETICLKCLEKSPAKRYASAADLAEDLSHWQRMEPIKARRTWALGRVLRWCRRNPLAAGVTAVAAVAIVALSAIFYTRLLIENAATRDAFDQVKIERDDAEVAREEGQDILARSYYEQARAVRLSQQPGRRRQALELIRKSKALVSRARRDGPATEAQRNLPSVAELRREATAALLLEDAREARDDPLASVSNIRGRDMALTPDGSHALSVFADETKINFLQSDAHLRLFDLSKGGGMVADKSIPYEELSAFALSPDGRWLALPDKMGGNVRLLRLDKNDEERLLPEIKTAGPPPDEGPYYLPPLQFSPDCRYLLGNRLEGDKQHLLLWDLREPARSRELAVSDDLGFEVSFRSDGRMLAYYTDGDKITLHDLSGQGKPTTITLPLPIFVRSQVASFRPFADSSMVWSPTPPILSVMCIAPDKKKVVVFWDTERKEEVARWEADFDPNFACMTFRPDGRWLAGGGWSDGSIRCYDLIERREVLRLENAHAMPVRMVKWTGLNRLLSLGIYGGGFKSWEINGTNFQSTIHDDPVSVNRVTFNPANGDLAILEGGSKSGVVVGDPKCGKLRRLFPLGQEDFPLGQDEMTTATMLFHPEGRQLAIIGQSIISIWDTQSGGLLRRHKGQGISAQIGPFLADGRMLAVPGGYGESQDRIVVKDLISGREVGPGIKVKIVEEGDLFAEFQARYLSSDGRLLFGGPEAGSELSHIQVWEVETGKSKGELRLPAEERASISSKPAISFDGEWLCLHFLPAVGSEPRLQLWHVPTRERRWQLPLNSPNATDWPIISRDSKLIALALENGVVEIRALGTGEELVRWQVPAITSITDIALAPDSGYLAVHDRTAPVHLLHLGELKRALDEMGLGW